MTNSILSTVTIIPFYSLKLNGYVSLNVEMQFKRVGKRKLGIQRRRKKTRRRKNKTGRQAAEEGRKVAFYGRTYKFLFRVF